jgi:hypothetical protein
MLTILGVGFSSLLRVLDFDSGMLGSTTIDIELLLTSLRLVFLFVL